MKLKDYLAQERGRQTALALAIGAYTSDVSAWASGARNVPIHYGPAIEQATDGEVTRQDLFPDSWRKFWPELAKVKRQ